MTEFRGIPFHQLLGGQEFRKHPNSVVVYRKLIHGQRFNAVVVRPGREAYEYIEPNTLVYVEDESRRQP